MEIIPYEAGLSADLASAGNEVLRGVPHCYPVSAEELAAAAAPAAGGDASHRRLHSERALVARDGECVRGFIHLAIERPDKPDHAEQGIIRFFWYRRADRAAGQALLDAAARLFRQRQMTRVTAFWQDYRYPFYHLDHAYLSDRLGHVAALLGFNGFEKIAGEVYLDWPNYEPGEPAATRVPHEIAVEWEPGRGARPNATVKAMQGDRAVGVCHSVCCGEWSRAADAQDWFLTVWLGIDEKLRGQGLGRHLLARARQELHAVGYRHAAISTSWDNHRAFLFYSNHGYRVCDWTYGFSRPLDDAAR